MPSRISLPNLNVLTRFMTSNINSNSNNTPSPRTPRPMSATTRRRLRGALPPSPIAARPAPPREPDPWYWQCCSCNAFYPLSCTNRCLDCSHRFCSESTYLPSTARVKAQRPKKRRTDKDGRTVTCMTQFDYEGWAAWGAWRRSVLGCDVTERERDAKFYEASHSDWMDCDFTFECCARRMLVEDLKRRGLYNVAEEEDEPSDEEYEAGEEEEEEDEEEELVSRPASKPVFPDDDALVLNEAIDIRQPNCEAENGITSPESPPSLYSFFWDTPVKAAAAKEKDAWWKLGSDHSPSHSAVVIDDSQRSGQQQLYSFFDEDDTPSAVRPKASLGQLTVRNYSEVDWQDWDGDSSDDSLEDAEDGADARKRKGTAEGYERELEPLIKGANAFWGDRTL